MNDAKQLAQDALENERDAVEAMNTIDQATLPGGVWDVLYAQGEAIGQLAAGLMILASKDRADALADRLLGPAVGMDHQPRGENA